LYTSLGQPTCVTRNFAICHNDNIASLSHTNTWQWPGTHTIMLQTPSYVNYHTNGNTVSIQVSQTHVYGYSTLFLSFLAQIENSIAKETKIQSTQLKYHNLSGSQDGHSTLLLLTIPIQLYQNFHFVVWRLGVGWNTGSYVLYRYHFLSFFGGGVMDFPPFSNGIWH
jgi:hypothetical protein